MRLQKLLISVLLNIGLVTPMIKAVPTTQSLTPQEEKAIINAFTETARQKIAEFSAAAKVVTEDQGQAFEQLFDDTTLRSLMYNTEIAQEDMANPDHRQAIEPGAYPIIAAMRQTVDLYANIYLGRITASHIYAILIRYLTENKGLDALLKVAKQKACCQCWLGCLRCFGQWAQPIAQEGAQIAAAWLVQELHRRATGTNGPIATRELGATPSVNETEMLGISSAPMAPMPQQPDQRNSTQAHLGDLQLSFAGVLPPASSSSSL